MSTKSVAKGAAVCRRCSERRDSLAAPNSSSKVCEWSHVDERGLRMLVVEKGGGRVCEHAMMLQV